jgi:hypothetical protein
MSDNIKQFERGPYLSAALLCERVLEEKDGVKSAIRIIDRITRTQIGPNPSMDMEPFDYNVTLLIKFKSGWARGVYPVKIQIAKPSGELVPEITNSVLFEGEEDRGIDIVGNIVIKLDQTGIYWIHVYLNDLKITQIPLRVTYMPQVRQVRGGNPLQE